MESAAPGRVTLMAAALLARIIHSFSGIPSMIPAMKYPVKVSPAAVVSTAFTVIASCRIEGKVFRALEAPLDTHSGEAA